MQSRRTHALHVVVQRELGLDVRNRDVAPNSYNHSLGDLRDIELAIHHREIETVGEVMAEELIACDAVRGRIALVLAINF
jgi:hypothetical protein